MAYLLFVDESGHDQESPYEVLAGVAVEDSRLWPLIESVHAAEVECFGRRVTHDHEGQLELKAKKLLKRKTFTHAGVLPPIEPARRRELALEFLQEGALAKAEGRPCRGGREHFAALGQAKLAFVKLVFEQLKRFDVRVMASIVDRDAPRPTADYLRKDYAYLLERFFYFLDEQRDRPMGLVVFDEIERVQSHILVNQIKRYFRETAVGKHRAQCIVPEPLFVHSDLTTLVQVADLVAYVIVWGFREKKMEREARSELESFVRSVRLLRHRAHRTLNGRPFHVWSFAVIPDLRCKADRLEEEAAAPSVVEDEAAA